VLLLFLRQLGFPKIINTFFVKVREHEVKNIRIPFRGTAFDAFFDVLAKLECGHPEVAYSFTHLW
jgi:hypothetical protein